MGVGSAKGFEQCQQRSNILYQAYITTGPALVTPNEEEEEREQVRSTLNREVWRSETEQQTSLCESVAVSRCGSQVGSGIFYPTSPTKQGQSMAKSNKVVRNDLHTNNHSLISGEGEYVEDP